MRYIENTNTIDMYQKSIDLFNEFKIILATVFVALIFWAGIFLLSNDYKKISIEISESDTLQLDLGKAQYNILTEEGFTQRDLYLQFTNNVKKKYIFQRALSKFNFDEKINNSLYDSFKVINADKNIITVSITLLSNNEELGKEIINTHIDNVHTNTMDNLIQYFKSYKVRNSLKIQNFKFERILDLANAKQSIVSEIDYINKKYDYELINRIGVIRDNIKIAKSLNFVESQNLENITVINNEETKILSLEYPLDDQLFYLGTKILHSVLEDLIAKASNENYSYNISVDLLSKKDLVENLIINESIYDVPSLGLFGYDQIKNLEIENRRLESILELLNEKIIKRGDEKYKEIGKVVNYNLDEIKIEKFGMDLKVSLIITLIVGLIVGCILALYRTEYKERFLKENSI